CDHFSFSSLLLSFLSITLMPHTTLFRSDLPLSGTSNDHLVADFREILRINARAKIDSSRGKNIRGPASLTTHGDADDAAVGASFLSEICDLKEAIFRDGDCQRRSCNDPALECPGKNQARIQEKEGSQPPTEVHFVRHMLRRHRPNEI